jgi:hypothetical protein
MAGMEATNIPGNNAGVFYDLRHLLAIITDKLSLPVIAFKRDLNIVERVWG